jgi:preprotein translocase subunit SecG
VLEIKRKDIKSLANYFIVAFTIFMSSDSLLFGSNGSSMMITIRNYLYVVLFIILLVYVFMKKYRKLKAVMFVEPIAK